ncbi:MAG: FAD binding domain-containing protein [Actinomycetota bacterium]|jgi:CO/xanthine dehydrogenase FAD-binding subunit|nr:FAD binding domain-containing protein [Actinomycetota bacterium]
MEFLAPTSWDEALAVKAEHPEAEVIAGGTDVMVDLNFDRRRPAMLVDLTRIADLATWQIDGSVLTIGAGVTYARIIDELSTLAPGLAIASRTVGSPQIRNRGTIGGNLGSASPAGDAHPPLLATKATVEVASARGSRSVPVEKFFTGAKRHVLAPDELIAAVTVPVAAGPQQFAKVGTRNAMVIAVTSFALALDPHAHAVGTGIGSAAPTPIRAEEAERVLAGELAAADQWEHRRPLDDHLVDHFARLSAEAAAPIDDVRGTAAYRRHALAVLARRTLSWAWSEYQRN